jgi:Metallo-peptidase family M12B Reprolysin-like
MAMRRTLAMLALSPAMMLPLDGRSLTPASMASRETVVTVSTGADVIARFDALVLGSLPATIAIRTGDSDANAGRTSILTLVARLRTSVTFPDEAPATLYRATFDGNAAVVTRSNDGLDISVARDDGIHVISLSMDSPAVALTHLTPRTPAGTQRSRRSIAFGFEGDVEHLEEPSAPMPLADPLAPVEIRIFLHDELRSSRARDIHAGYVAWWLRDMESSILPANVSMTVVYLQPIPGISDQPYGSPSSLATWRKAVDRYVASRGIRRTWKNKYVLITPNHPAEGKLGQSAPESGVATATLSGPYSVVAHELGHLFGADHAQAEWRGWGWWPCRTNMYPHDTPLLANCYAYSSANIASIQSYIDLKGYLPPHMGDAPAGDP